MDLHTVRAGVNHLLRCHQQIGGKIRWSGIGSEVSHGAVRLNCGARGTVRIRMEIGHAAAREYWRPFEALAFSDRLRRTAGDIHAPDVAPVNIVLVRGEHRFVPIF